MNNFFVHSSAIIDSPCTIGQGTHIWHFSHLMSGCRVGKNCTVGQNVFIGGLVTVGNGVKIQNNVSLFDGVSIEDDVFIGPCAAFTNVKRPRAHRNQKHQFAKTHIEKGVTIGANTTIICGLRIGRHAFIGAGAVVTKDVVPHALMVGNPAIQTGWVCKCGTTLDENLFCPDCQTTTTISTATPTAI